MKKLSIIIFVLLVTIGLNACDDKKEDKNGIINSIGSFSECEKLPDSKVIQGNPKTCITKQGITFTYDALVDDPFVYEEQPVK